MWEPSASVKLQSIENVSETLAQVKELAPGTRVTYQTCHPHLLQCRIALQLRITEQTLVSLKAEVERRVSHKVGGEIELKRFKAGQHQVVLSLFSDQSWRITEGPEGYRHESGRLHWNKQRDLGAFDPWQQVQLRHVAQVDQVQPGAYSELDEAPRALLEWGSESQKQRQEEEEQRLVEMEWRRRALSLQQTLWSEKASKSLWEEQRRSEKRERAALLMRRAFTVAARGMD